MLRVKCRHQQSHYFEIASLPATQLNPVSEFGQLVWKPPLFDDTLWCDRYFTKRVSICCCSEGKLPDCLSHHFFSRRVFPNHDVSRLLIRLEDS